MKLKELQPNAYYDDVIGKPKTIERDNDGTWLYRYNVEPHLRQDVGGDEEQVGWQCRELRLFTEPTIESLKSAIIDSVYSVDARLEVINRHNAYMSALSSDASIVDEYKGFIQFCKDVDTLLGCTAEASHDISVPRFVTNRQLRLALLSKGLELETITEVLNRLPDGHKQAALVSWEYAPTFERNNPLIAQLAPQFGFDGEALDNIFVEANKL